MARFSLTIRVTFCLPLILFSNEAFHLLAPASSDAAPLGSSDVCFADGAASDRSRPLWGGARFTNQDSARAIRRGIQYIYRSARKPRNFAAHGFDYLWFSQTTAIAFKDADLQRIAHLKGVELARRWRAGHRSIPAGADAATVLVFAFGSNSAEGLGVPDVRVKQKIREAAARLSAYSFFDFDPAIEPPPTDVPEECVRCGRDNPRGSTVCGRCKARLRMRSRYDLWCDALFTTWAGDHYGVKLGAHYSDVLQWLPNMRPYRGREGGANPDFHDAVYAVTHLVYTLNDYSVYKLSPAWLPQEFEFLKGRVKEAIAIRDVDMLGELMDSLKSFGLTNDDPLIQTGVEYLLSHQNPDGSWGSRRLRYHPTWTAIDGLSDYAWRGEGLSFPRLEPLLTPNR